MKNSFIPASNRPIPTGALLNEHHRNPTAFNLNDGLFIEVAGESDVQSICFGPSSDYVIKLVDRHTRPEDKIKILYLEDMFKSWSFFCRDGELQFVMHDAHYGNLLIRPKLLYFRASYIKDKSKYFLRMFNFVNMLNFWKGTVLCKPIDHNRNTSKLLQAILTIIPAAQKTKANVITPVSYVVKGLKSYKKLAKKNLIVKSLSSVRSDILDAKVFDTWDSKTINHLPVLFQKIVSGNDIRVHKLYETMRGKKIYKTINKNYRYHTRKSKTEDYHPQGTVAAFCDAIAAIENNPLLGVDLMETSNGQMICFEANPGPGWSAYHENEADDGDSFLSAFMRVLRNADPAV